MKDCCLSTKSDKECIRKKDKKTFKLPRRFSKERCKKGIKGFTMRSSCAPYKGCNKKGGSKKYKSKQKNMNKKTLRICSKNPLTGYNRSGYCETDMFDMGSHLVCAKMNKRFLNYTAKKGNDLSSVVKPGDKWCLCANRWLEAWQNDVAPPVILAACEETALKIIPLEVLRKFAVQEDK